MVWCEISQISLNTTWRQIARVNRLNRCICEHCWVTKHPTYRSTRLAMVMGYLWFHEIFQFEQLLVKMVDRSWVCISTHILWLTETCTWFLFRVMHHSTSASPKCESPCNSYTIKRDTKVYMLVGRDFSDCLSMHFVHITVARARKTGRRCIVKILMGMELEPQKHPCDFSKESISQSHWGKLTTLWYWQTS